MKLPFINIRNLVVYPGTETSIHVGREISVAAVEAARADLEQRLVLIAQKRGAQNDDVTADDMYRLGTVVRLEQAVRLGDGMKFHGVAVAAYAVDEILLESGVRRAVGRERAPWEDASAVPETLRQTFDALLRTWCARLSHAEHPGLARLPKEKTRAEFFAQACSIISYFDVDKSGPSRDIVAAAKGGLGAAYQRSMDTHRELNDTIVAGRQRLLEESRVDRALALLEAMLRDELRLTEPAS